MTLSLLLGSKMVNSFETAKLLCNADLLHFCAATCSDSLSCAFAYVF